MTSKKAKLLNLYENATRAEIKEAWDILHKLSSILEQKETMLLRVGQKVEFKGRWDRAEQGTITKVNRKSVGIRTTGGENWNVAPSLLTVGK